MNRDRMTDKYLHVRPNFYAVLDDKILLIWARKPPDSEPYLISAILSPLGPFNFKSHRPTSHAGNYIFRRLGKRIYIHNIIKFSDDFWDLDTRTVSYRKFSEKIPYIKFNDLI